MVDTPGSSTGGAPSLGVWNQQAAVQFEVAETVLADLIADCSERLAMANAGGNAEDVERTTAERDEYAAARRDLVASRVTADAVISKYGPTVRAKFHSEP